MEFERRNVLAKNYSLPSDKNIIKLGSMYKIPVKANRFAWFKFGYMCDLTLELKQVDQNIL